MDEVILTHSITTKNNTNNILVIGACETSKTEFFVKPNLLSISDNIIAISGDNDGLLEKTASFRKEKLKQKIFTQETFKENIKDLDYFGDKYTLYLTASHLDKNERINLLHYTFGWIMDCIYYSAPKKPITIIIDDLSLFPICGDIMTHKVDNVRIIATVQSIDVLYQTYKHPEKILNSFGIKMFFHTNGLNDAEYMSSSFISKEMAANLKSDEALIIGLLDNPIIANDKILHWWSYGK
jgi:hypothetical protein